MFLFCFSNARKETLEAELEETARRLTEAFLTDLANSKSDKGLITIESVKNLIIYSSKNFGFDKNNLGRYHSSINKTLKVIRTNLLYERNAKKKFIFKKVELIRIVSANSELVRNRFVTKLANDSRSYMDGCIKLAIKIGHVVIPWGITICHSYHNVKEKNVIKKVPCIFLVYRYAIYPHDCPISITDENQIKVDSALNAYNKSENEEKNT